MWLKSLDNEPNKVVGNEQHVHKILEKDQMCKAR